MIGAAKRLRQWWGKIFTVWRLTHLTGVWWVAAIFVAGGAFVAWLVEAPSNPAFAHGHAINSRVWMALILGTQRKRVGRF